MEITETDWKGSLVEILETISSIEDKMPKKGSKAYLEQRKKLIKLYEEYNTRVSFKAFNTTI